MSYFSSAVLSLIASLELVLLARHNMRGQMRAVSFAGPLLPLLALPQEHLPPCGPNLSHPECSSLQVLGTWGQRESERMAGQGRRRSWAWGMPGIRQQTSGQPQGKQESLLSVPSSKDWARRGTLSWLAGDSFPCLLEPGPHSRLSSFPGDLQPREIRQALPCFRPTPVFLVRSLFTSAGGTIPASGRLSHSVISGGLALAITSSEPSSRAEEGARRADPEAVRRAGSAGPALSPWPPVPSECPSSLGWNGHPPAGQPLRREETCGPLFPLSPSQPSQRPPSLPRGESGRQGTDLGLT